MSFKENLKRKILVDQLAERVNQSLGAPGSGKKIDKAAMRSLLDMAGYQVQRARGLELYRQLPLAEKDRLLVLDNELAMYFTSLADVLLRKNPTVKEMVNVFNMFKILDDKDVAVSKGADSLATVREQCLAELDLSYTETDIREIAEEGHAALANKNSRQVNDVLMLFEVLLSLRPPPIPVSVPKIFMIGKIQRDVDNGITFGPLILYDQEQHRLKYFECRLGVAEMKKPQVYLDMAGGRESASFDGEEVFDALAAQVIAEGPQLQK